MSNDKNSTKNPCGEIRSVESWQKLSELIKNQWISLGRIGDPLPDIDYDEDNSIEMKKYLEKYKKCCNKQDIGKNSAGGVNFKQCKNCKKDLGDWDESEDSSSKR